MLYLNIGYKINVYIVYDANIMTFFESTHTICKKVGVPLHLVREYKQKSQYIAILTNYSQKSKVEIDKFTIYCDFHIANYSWVSIPK